MGAGPRAYSEINLFVAVLQPLTGTARFFPLSVSRNAAAAACATVRPGFLCCLSRRRPGSAALHGLTFGLSSTAWWVHLKLLALLRKLSVSRTRVNLRPAMTE